MSNGWIGVDLDGVLAEYHGFIAPSYIGKPIPKMVERVKALLKSGVEVKIFTARIDPIGLGLYSLRTGDLNSTVDSVKHCIREWCKLHIGVELDITDRKDLKMLQLWDDQCLEVVRNTGDFVRAERTTFEMLEEQRKLEVRCANCGKNALREEDEKKTGVCRACIFVMEG